MPSASIAAISGTGNCSRTGTQSIVCQEDAYLLELVRYIHLNPLHAGMVQDLKALADYAFSGHRLLAGAGDCSWQEGGYVLGYFVL